ncbi:MAG: F0F1 ATP synthase subunit delta [Firmicutes bacterium]|nr:F0F1 ATP synthase subunit delta [Bacillota bacterium]
MRSRKKVVIRVVTPSALDAVTAQNVEAVFTGRHKGAVVSFVYELDPRYLGGILVIDGDDYYDATLSRQLSVIRQKLTSNE